MKKVLLLIFAGLSSVSAIAQWAWHTRASLPAAGRESAACFTIGEDLYVVCGRTSITPYAHVSELWQYNSITDTWTQKSNYPGGARTAPMAFAVAGKGYVVSGGYPTMYNDCWQYDPLTDTWTQKNNFPGAGRYTTAHFVLGSKAYMVGGYYNGTQQDEVWEYDTTTDQWLQLNDFPGGNVQAATGFAIGGAGYIVAGVTGHSNYVALTAAWKYVQSGDTWTSIPSFPGQPRVGPVSFVVNGKGYVGAGASATFATHYADFYAYDPVVNSWAPAPSLPASGRRQAVGCQIGNAGFVGTGVESPWSASPITFFSDLYSFSSTVELPEEEMGENMSVRSVLVSEQLQIHLQSHASVAIHNMNGQIVWEAALPKGTSVIPVAGMPAGCYFISCVSRLEYVRFLVVH